jgi:hypothetical protein
LPFGDTFAEAGYTFASAYHGKPIVNGYSGFFPRRYQHLKAVLTVTPVTGDAWTALAASGATHVIVHESAYGDLSTGRRVSDWLRTNGAHEVATLQTDHIFRLR